MRYVGIDPGKKGAIAVIDDNANVISTYVLPLKGKDIDLDGLCDIMSDLAQSAEVIFMEMNKSLFKASKGTMYTMGRVIGNIEASVHCNGGSIKYVKPRIWQREVWEAVDEVKRDPKGTSLKCAERLFPTADLKYGDNEKKSRRRTKPHDGIVDALLIAEYAKRNGNGHGNWI